jgi:hypothetical protein
MKHTSSKKTKHKPFPNKKKQETLPMTKFKDTNACEAKAHPIFPANTNIAHSLNLLERHKNHTHQ